MKEMKIKKLIWLIATLPILVCACGNGSKEPIDPVNPDGEVKIIVATCNLLKPSTRRTEMSMDNQKVRSALAGTIAATKADIIGFNEVDETHIGGGKYSLQAICASIKDWQWKLQWPNRMNAAGALSYYFADGFAYNSAKLKLEECGYVWLSKEDDTWYTNPVDAYQKCGNPERTCIWIRFTHIASGKEFWAFPTHLPHPDHGGALNMAKVVNRFAAEKAGTAPAILFGDMNSAPGYEEETYRALLDYWKDGNINASWGTMSGSSKSYYYPWESFSGGHPERRIDHILTKNSTASDYHRVVVPYTINETQWCPSDHLTIAATVKF
jgi:endonuclease/exonuclease/phosphatase family metal-dependent hydrolase